MTGNASPSIVSDLRQIVTVEMRLFTWQTAQKAYI